MILTSKQRPIWRLSYRDYDDPNENGTFPRAVVYTDFLEITPDLIIMGECVMKDHTEPGADIRWQMLECGDRTVVAKSALIFADFGKHYRDIWLEAEGKPFWRDRQRDERWGTA